MYGALFPHRSLAWDQTMVGLWWPPPKGLMPPCTTPRTAAVSVPDPAAGHSQPTPQLETPEYSQASLVQSLVRSPLLSPESWGTQGFLVPSKSLFPQSILTWLRSVFIPIQKKINAIKCSNYHTIALISHAHKVMLKMLQARLQYCLNWEIPDVQAGFRKGRGTRDQIATIHWIVEKTREFQENIYFCFIDYTKAFGCVDHKKL